MKKSSNKLRMSLDDKIFMTILNVFLWIVLILVSYPIIYVISASFSRPTDVISGRVWLWPVNFSLLGYEAVFNNPNLITGFKNSLIYGVFGTAFNVCMTIMAAYPLSRKKMVGRGFFMTLFIITMFFSGGLVPTFLVVKNLGIYDTRLAMILPTAISVWNVVITRTFFTSTIPEEMYEAAQIDGSNDFKTLIKLILPLSMPIIAVISLYYFVGHWNSYFNALIYLQTKQLFPLQIILRDILILSDIDGKMIENIDINVILKKQGLKDVVKFSVIVIASAPVLVLYPFVQKYFVKGVMIGALKG